MDDTDSLLIAMTADKIEDLVLPEKREEWESEIKNIWFADSSIRSQKTPGYLKLWIKFGSIDYFTMYQMIAL